MSNNLDLVRRVYEAFAVGDIPAVLGLLSPDVHYTEAEGGPYGGVSIGPDAVLKNVFSSAASGMASPQFPASSSLTEPRS